MRRDVVVVVVGRSFGMGKFLFHYHRRQHSLVSDHFFRRGRDSGRSLAWKSNAKFGFKNAANLKNSEIIKFGEIDKTSGYSITITQLRHRAFHPYLAKILSSLTSPLIMQVVLILNTLF